MSYVPFKIKYTAYCYLCGSKHEKEYELPFDAVIPKYEGPQEWTRLDNQLFCDKHSLDEIAEFFKSMV
jgi:Holliday junction resolvase-like predicted endonuclease